MYTLYRIYQHNARRKGKKQRSFSRAPPQTQPNGLIFMTENQEESSDILWTLGQGVTLLHAVAQADTAFLQHHSPVQAQYISLLSGLRAVFKANIGTWEFHCMFCFKICNKDLIKLFKIPIFFSLLSHPLLLFYSYFEQCK